MALEVSSLRNAVQRLREGLLRCQQNPADEQIRDGLIHRFEFTYDLSHKMLRRFLREEAASSTEVDWLAFSDLIRAASKAGLLLGDLPAWRIYRDMRARTSHTYHVAALEVVAGIPRFLDGAAHLCAELERRLV